MADSASAHGTTPGTASGQPPPAVALGPAARSAVAWNAVFNVFRDVLQFGVMLVLVRLISPAAYGQFGLVNAVIGFMSAWSFKVFVAHTLQVRRDADVCYQEHFTAGAVIQAAVVVATNLVALGLWFSETYSAVALLVHLMSIGFVLDWPSQLCIQMLQRELNWKRLRLLHAIGLTASSVVAIGLALAGAGVYALLFPGLLVTVPFIFDLFYSRRWRPSWTWSYRRFAPALRFGLARSSSAAVSMGRQLVTNGVLVHALGFAFLGIFNRALGLGTLFCSKLSAQLLQSLYPVLTRIEPRSARYRRASALVLRVVAWIVLPTVALVSVLAEPVVRLLYGERWLEVIPLLPYAVALAGLTGLSGVAYELLLAHQRHSICLVIDVCGFAGTLLALWLVLPYGAVALLVVLSGIQVHLLGVSVLCLAWDDAISWSGVWRAFGPSCVAAGVALAVCELLWRSASAGLSHSGAPLLYAATFAVIYVGSLRIGFRELLAELLEHVPARRTIRQLLLLPAVTQ